jgi:hypothetical protein
MRVIRDLIEGENMTSESAELTLRPMKRGEYSSFLIIVSLWFFCFLLLMRSRDFGSTESLAQALWVAIPATLGLIAVLIPLMVLTERLRKKTLSWRLTRQELTFERKLGSRIRATKISLDNVIAINLNAFNWKLERGIKVTSFDGIEIFIPSLTDRFFEGMCLLESIGRDISECR